MANIEGENLTAGEAYSRLSDMRAELSSTFGYPRDPGYCAYYRLADKTRLKLSNGPWSGTGDKWSISKE